MVTRLLISFVILLNLIGVADAAPLKVAVAANFKPVLKQLTPQFEQQYQTKVSLSSASTGMLYAQIRHGAPFDILLAADEKRPALLEKEQQIVAGSRQTYAIGQLVLWHKNQAAPDQALLTGWNKKIAIANAKTAPYGMAAKSVLQHLNLWQQKRPLLVTGSNIAQTQQFIESGNAVLGFVGLSQVKGQVKSRVKGQVKGQLQAHDKSYWVLPADWYPQLNQQLVILKRSKNPAAKTFVNWLLSAKIQQQLVAAGYGSSLAH